MTQIKHTVCDNKYTVVFEETGQLYALRYDEPWRDLTGDGLVLAMLQEIDNLKQQLEEARKDYDRA